MPKHKYANYDRKPAIDDFSKLKARLEALRPREQFTFHIGDIELDGEKYPDVKSVALLAQEMEQEGSITIIKKPVLATKEGRQTFAGVKAKSSLHHRPPQDIEHIAVGVDA